MDVWAKKKKIFWKDKKYQTDGCQGTKIKNQIKTQGMLK